MPWTLPPGAGSRPAKYATSAPFVWTFASAAGSELASAEVTVPPGVTL